MDFNTFFSGPARKHLEQAVDHALDEDGPDLTSWALFSGRDSLRARIVSKEEAVVSGLPMIPMIFQRLGQGEVQTTLLAADGDLVKPWTVLARMTGPALAILKAERVILNFITHLSGVATLTRRFASQLAGGGTRLLDTRKTLPGLRYPEKYAVLCGGGLNHRLDLAQMLMLKDNHIDRAGGIAGAVAALRRSCSPCPPIEVECRTLDDVREAAASGVDRIMLDNMGPEEIIQALKLVPEGMESEISGGVSLENISRLGALGATYISVGRITHSAPASDFSLQVELEER